MGGYLSDDYEEYIQNHYGFCRCYDPKVRGSCMCLLAGHRGKLCPNWEPIKENSIDEMVERCKTDERYKK